MNVVTCKPQGIFGILLTVVPFPVELPTLRTYSSITFTCRVSSPCPCQHMAYFFASAIDVDIKLEGEELRKQVEIKSDKDKNITCPVYYDGDSVTGQVRFSLRCIRFSWGIQSLTLKVTIRVRDGKKTTHDGIKVEFVGSIGSFSFSRANSQAYSFRKSYSMTEGIIMNSCRYLRN